MRMYIFNENNNRLLHVPNNAQSNTKEQSFMQNLKKFIEILNAEGLEIEM